MVVVGVVVGVVPARVEVVLDVGRTEEAEGEGLLPGTHWE